jgi:hypothetical protein
VIKRQRIPYYNCKRDCDYQIRKSRAHPIELHQTHQMYSAMIIETMPIGTEVAVVGGEDAIIINKEEGTIM